ncbi:hypothetical protein QDY72_07445 [Kingella negevensis]|uniref:hypothetical protein n=1 Tax=Kingella negevensis TaxID=1522312 RepID=UPI00254C68AB|nr:hypothetical protein [Kingella negevensis]MDK4680146.1 hypothetical protein [Kingella negevensis]MDK4682134.1 hypothetical protein [Kingella negevensis]MDK4685007.1 hypothetical protein [Kingella negevensis]MDK4690330.1 hypothetical protein [Kingella negevensis]MDK4692323.1 hypothetical protein [Kingella negevensis]
MPTLISHTPTRVPVTVYRATDEGAPVLKNEKGSLKTLLKTLLAGDGYGNKKSLRWQMYEETSTEVTFHYGTGFGLKVDNANSGYINTHMVHGDKFETYLGNSNQGLNNFAHINNYAMQNWLLVGHSKGFMLVLPESPKTSQILFFGETVGFFKDERNVAYVNTSYGSNNSWDNGSLNDSSHCPILMPSSAFKDPTGAFSSPTTVVVNPLSPFSTTALTFPDTLYQNCLASAITLVEQDGSPRSILPALFWSAHDLQNVSELSKVEMQDGQDYIKLNLHDSGERTHCFVLNLTEWEL